MRFAQGLGIFLHSTKRVVAAFPRIHLMPSAHVVWINSQINQWFVLRSLLGPCQQHVQNYCAKNLQRWTEQ